MAKHRSLRRSVAPILSVLILALISYLVYFGSRRIENHLLRQSLAAGFGTLYFVSIFFGPLYIYTVTYLRGVPLPGRLLACCLIPFLWMTKDVLVMTESHPFLESLYWYLNPMYIWLACLLVIEIGLGTLLARYILVRRGQPMQVITAAPIAAILIGVVVFGGIYAWGQGENLFSIYLDGYRLLFGSGV
jgi:hypothetical protein